MALREHAAGVTGQGARKKGKTKTLNYKDPSASKCTAKKICFEFGHTFLIMCRLALVSGTIARKARQLNSP